MPQRIAEDHYRYRQIIGGQVRDDLKGLITSGGFTRQRPNGRGKMSVNIPEIDLPRIVHGRAGEGVGKGEGEVGDTVGKDPGKGKGGKPGDGDREVQEIFAVRCDLPLEAYTLHPEEVDGIARVGLDDALALFRGEVAAGGSDGLQDLLPQFVAQRRQSISV